MNSGIELILFKQYKSMSLIAMRQIKFQKSIWSYEIRQYSTQCFFLYYNRALKIGINKIDIK